MIHDEQRFRLVIEGSVPPEFLASMIEQARNITPLDGSIAVFFGDALVPPPTALQQHPPLNPTPTDH